MGYIIFDGLRKFLARAGSSNIEAAVSASVKPVDNPNSDPCFLLHSCGEGAHMHYSEGFVSKMQDIKPESILNMTNQPYSSTGC